MSRLPTPPWLELDVSERTWVLPCPYASPTRGMQESSLGVGVYHPSFLYVHQDLVTLAGQGPSGATLSNTVCFGCHVVECKSGLRPEPRGASPATPPLTPGLRPAVRRLAGALSSHWDAQSAWIRYEVRCGVSLLSPPGRRLVFHRPQQPNTYSTGLQNTSCWRHVGFRPRISSLTLSKKNRHACR
jgi:hypothetical protein